MANKTVTLYRKCKTSNGWKHFAAAMSANGKVKPNTVIEDGDEVVYSTGHYELRSFEGSKTVWTPISGNATEALVALKTAQKSANAKAIASDAGIGVISDTSRQKIGDLVRRWLAVVLERGSKEAAELYERTMGNFVAGCKKVYLDELTHEDIVTYDRQERNRGMQDRTVANRHAHVRSFLFWCGLDQARIKEIAGPKPRFEKTFPEVYEPDELKSFFESLNDHYDSLLFDVLLTTGLREKEVAHLEWNDIRWSRAVLKVESKPKWQHKIKDAEEREMPLTDDLAERLKTYRKSHPTASLIFGTDGGRSDRPDGHLLRRLKRIVKKAGLNCDTCASCKSTKECEQWFLHKFRATYITTLLWNGLDLRTVMQLSGHADLESVMRYLRPAEGEIVQDKVNSIKWR